MARVGSGSANQPTRSQRNARAALRGYLSQAFAAPPELTEHALADWAIRYLESGRLLGQAPAPLSPADQLKLTPVQAHLMVRVITAVLEGIGVTDEVWEQGCDIAMRELKASSEEGWSPL
jgi:hypothetical protein